jgi:hypothetical protein
MNKKIEKFAKRFVRHMFETYKNKLAAIMMLAIGIVSAKISGDATFLVLAIVFCTPLFFVKKNCFK